MAKRNYTVNDDFFSIINTEEKAYWLGFLYADGNIAKKTNEITLELKDLDIEHISSFKEAISCEKEIRRRSNRPAATLNFSSKQMKLDLCRLGCVPAKSNILTFPNDEQVPQELKLHFIRGYVDGDGCISRYVAGDGYKKQEFSFAGTKDFIQGVLDFTNWSSHKIKPKSEYVYEISYRGKEDFNSILKSLYENATIFLNRKYEIYSRGEV